MSNNVAAIAKALTGAVVAALAVLATSLDNGELNAQEGIYAAIAFFTALGAVWVVPNRDPAGVKQDQSVQPPNVNGAAAEGRERGQRGAGEAVWILAVIGIVLLVLVLFGFLR